MAGANGLLELHPIARVEADFRQNYITMFDEWRKENRERKLGPRDVVMFHNTGWSVIHLVYRPTEVRTRETNVGVETEAMRCITIRVRRGSIGPWMIQRYAEKHGIDLGLPGFKQYYKRNRKAA